MVAREGAPDVTSGVDTRDEIDLARYGRRLAARWWIVALTVLVAVGIALLREGSGNAPRVSEARALVNIGSPLSPSGVLIPGALQSNPLFASILLRQSDIQNRATAAAGLPTGALRGHISTQAAGAVTAATRAGASQLMYVIVRGDYTPRQAAAAANSLAAALRDATNRYQRATEAALQAQISRLQRRNAELQADTEALRGRVEQIDAQRNLSALDKLAAVTPSLAIIQSNGNVQAQNEQQINQSTLLLQSVNQISQSTVLSAAQGQRLGGGGGGSGVVAAILVGLIVGVLLALASTLVWPARR